MKNKLFHISNINQILERKEEQNCTELHMDPLFLAHLIVQHIGVHRVTFYYRDETEKGIPMYCFTGYKALHQGLFMCYPI